ncbi:hypothetical protein HY285_05675 [Candidatus Peregrinibacteria bacterium]|nr:hypothetical protein [Candidatus Peregrinibacteria bacterium]MBI3816996.1 hypothetical protein [Candidatus Peregrinibacteria bacterium]
MKTFSRSPISSLEQESRLCHFGAEIPEPARPNMEETVTKGKEGHAEGIEKKIDEKNENSVSTRKTQAVEKANEDIQKQKTILEDTAQETQNLEERAGQNLQEQGSQINQMHEALGDIKQQTEARIQQTRDLIERQQLQELLPKIEEALKNPASQKQAVDAIIDHLKPYLDPELMKFVQGERDRRYGNKEVSQKQEDSRDAPSDKRSNENVQSEEKKMELHKYSTREQQEADQFLKMEARKLSPELQKTYNAILSKLSPNERTAMTEYARSFENSVTAKTGMKLSEENFAFNVLFAGMDEGYSSPASTEALLNQCADECKSNMPPEKLALMRQAHERLEREVSDYRKELRRRSPNDPERQEYEKSLKEFTDSCTDTAKEIGNSLKGERENAMRDLSSGTLLKLMEKIGKQIGHKIELQENKDANQDKNRNKIAFTIKDVSKDQTKPIMELVQKVLKGATIKQNGKDITIEQADSLEAQNFLNRLKNEKLPRVTTK